MNFCSDSVSGKYIKVRIITKNRVQKPATQAVPLNSKFLSSNVKFWPFSISNRFLCIHRNSYPIFFSVRYRKSNELKSRVLLDRRWHLMYLHISLIRVLQISLWQPLYLHWLNIRCCRCSFCNCCICTALIFIVADTFFETDVSATYFSLNLQMLFSLSVMYNCIYILPFLELEDTSFANFSSASHVFYDLQMLLIKILHLQSPKIHYRRYLH